MKVWPVYQSSYDGDLLGLYSTPELAAAAALMYGPGKPPTWGGDKAHVGEPIEVDEGAAAACAGLIRWRIGFNEFGDLSSLRYKMGPATGARAQAHPDSNTGVWVECDAPSEDRAIEIAADLRTAFLADQHG